jgi:hypothetical protein
MASGFTQPALACAAATYAFLSLRIGPAFSREQRVHHSWRVLQGGSRKRWNESNPSGKRAMPEWWGLRVEGQLVRVVHWRELSPPTLSDFGSTVPSGVEYEIAPLHAVPAE